VSVVPIERIETTVTPLSVDTTLRVVRVRRIVPVLEAGKVVVPVNVYLIGSS
jgi:biotin synthase-related radical SAM superfamily protein